MATTETSPAAAAATFEPLSERVINDVETLKALSDPLRIRILEAMVQAAAEGWTAKRIAKALGVGQTKLYHHLKLLEDRELIKPVDRQLVRGIMETSYQIAQLSLRLDRNLLAAGGADVRASAQDAMSSVFDIARDDFERALATGLLPIDGPADDSRPFMLNRGLMKMSPAKATELRERLVALLEEYGAEPSGELPVGLFISLHAIPSSTLEPAKRKRK
ncbi:MAG TPA: helix-turn-helix domain-containing protein [Candidatus Polarisedimenticolia bacterium]|nr:helix-turn-helix domain-containing protein [Candidatus Polarisedimenticolia bacterium]